MKPLHIFHFTPFDKTLFDYPQWMQEVPEHPTPDQFYAAWHDVFGADFNDCLVSYGEVLFGVNLGVAVRTPNAIVYDGFMDGNFTDCPVLAEDQSFFYEGCGCTWGYDLIGQRYAKVDMKTGQAVDLEMVKRKLVILRSKIFQNFISQ